MVPGSLTISCLRLPVWCILGLRWTKESIGREVPGKQGQTFENAGEKQGASVPALMSLRAVETHTNQGATH